MGGWVGGSVGGRRTYHFGFLLDEKGVDLVFFFLERSELFFVGIELLLAFLSFLLLLLLLFFLGLGEELAQVGVGGGKVGGFQLWVGGWVGGWLG